MNRISLLFIRQLLTRLFLSGLFLPVLFLPVLGRLFLLAAAASLAACSSLNLPPLSTADHVDLESYLGTWYEIASLPHPKQKNCVATQAIYKEFPDGTLEIKNSCREGTLDGPMRSVKGKAWVVDPDTNSKLKLSFFWPFEGDYWILAVSRNYEYALVGTPSRKYLWVLSRRRTLDPKITNSLLEKAKALGFSLDEIQYTAQPPS